MTGENISSDMILDELLLEKKLKKGYEKWIKENKLNKSRISIDSLSKNLKQNFEDVPFNVTSINDLIGVIAPYFEQKERSSFHHVAMVGVENFGIEQILYTLLALFSPLCESHTFTMSIFRETQFTPLDDKKWENLVRRSDELLLMSGSGKSIYIIDIIREITKCMENGIFISFYDTEDWIDWKDTLLIKYPKTHVIKLKPISLDQTKSLINLLASFVEWDKPISEDIYKHFHTFGKGYPQKIVRIFIKAIQQAFLTNSNELNYHTIALAMVFDDTE